METNGWVGASESYDELRTQLYLCLKKTPRCTWKHKTNGMRFDVEQIVYLQDTGTGFYQTG